MGRGGYEAVGGVPPVTQETRAMYSQLARYAVAGAGAAAIYSLVYLVVAGWLPPGQAIVAVVPAFLISLVVSFQLHSRWSFGGHGSRSATINQPFRFFVVQTAGLLANFAMTYAVTNLLKQPNWVALIPCLTVTPLLTFAMQRSWVFR